MAAQKIAPAERRSGAINRRGWANGPALVMAQMPIFEDGYFVGEISKRDRPISFRSHGYKDLDVQLKDKGWRRCVCRPSEAKPLDKADHASLKGRVVLDGNSSAQIGGRHAERSHGSNQYSSQWIF